MRAFWVLIALLLAAAVVWLVSARGPATPTANNGDAAPSAPVSAPASAPPAKAAPSSSVPTKETAAPPSSKSVTPSAPAANAGPAPGAPAPSTPTKPVQTGIAQGTIEAAFKKAFPQVSFAPSNQSDGRRRFLGTLGQGRVPALELIGDETDLSQIAAVGATKTDDGPATIERAPFAVTLLDVVAPGWGDRKSWLSAALKSASETDANFKSDHTLGRLNVHFASWRSLGVYKLTVETVDAAALTAAAAAAVETAMAPAPAKPESLASNADAKATEPTSENPPLTPAGAKVEAKPDGSTLVDGKYILKGTGTKDDPYKLTWDQLVSVQDEYVPRDGRKEIPGRATMLNDKWVEITGYVAFPLMVDAPDECLSMMNQWDGCCIGIPPTPYDAVEIRLTEPVSGNARMTTYGTVRGKFKVDPHLVGGWLVGLYVMDNATLTPQNYGGFSP